MRHVLAQICVTPDKHSERDNELAEMLASGLTPSGAA
jgi:hypothetical protein